MWFLYMLIPLYLFTPFLRIIIAKCRKSEIVLLVIITFILAILNEIFRKSIDAGSLQLFTNLFLPYVPYFLTGYLIRSENGNFGKPLSMIFFMSSCCLTALGFYLFAFNKGSAADSYFYGYLSVTVVPMSVSAMYLLKEVKPIFNVKYTNMLSRLVLGVYLIHPLFLETNNHLGFVLTKYYPIVTIPITAIFVFIFSIVVSLLLYNLPFLKRII